MSYYDEEVARALAEQIKAVRKEKGISQEELAFRACLHRTEVGMIERGARVPRLDTLVKLKCSLEVSAEELLDGIEWLPARERRQGTFWTRKREGRRDA